MSMKKSQQTIEQRQRQVISRLKNINQELRDRVNLLEEKLTLKDQALENVLLRLAELEEIIFGKKKDKNDHDHNHKDKDNNLDSSAKPKRNKSSYTRPTPNENEVTDREEYNIDNCPDCGTKLTKKEFVIRYIEDIQLACTDALGKDKEIRKVKKVIKQAIARGYCPKCKKWPSAIIISNKITRAGPNVKMFVSYAVNILRLSFEQTKNILLDLYSFSISDGEIAGILEKTAQALKPELARLKQRILQAKSVHLDETGWRTKAEKNYNWVMASGDTEEAVFLVGKNRGKGQAEKLLDKYTGIRVTDCYSAYKNLSEEQAICWSHIIRKSRDLKNNSNLRKDKAWFVKNIHSQLMKLFRKATSIHQTKFNKLSRIKALPKLKNELDDIIKKVINSPKQSVKKLTDLAKLMKEYKKQLFTCLTYQGVDMTNNKAERKLRHIVLKRKNCFGTKTEKGNQIMEVNMSVLLSLWWNDRDRFFMKFKELMEG